MDNTPKNPKLIVDAVIDEDELGSRNILEKDRMIVMKELVNLVLKNDTKI